MVPDKVEWVSAVAIGVLIAVIGVTSDDTTLLASLVAGVVAMCWYAGTVAISRSDVSGGRLLVLGVLIACPVAVMSFVGSHALVAALFVWAVMSMGAWGTALGLRRHRSGSR